MADTVNGGPRRTGFPRHAAALRQVLGALLVISVMLSGEIRADGCFVWRNEQVDIHEPEQKALIYFHDGIEDLVLSVRFAGAPEDFGWIVPLPSVPEMFPEGEALFVYLSQATQERQFRRSPAGDRLHMTLGAAGIEVLRADTVGIYQAEVLRATRGEELDAWLEKTGYHLPPGAEHVLGRYARDGWIFATLKILPGRADSLSAQRLLDGTIQPVRFRFQAREPVFPLEISSLGRHPADILLYILAPEILVPRTPAGVLWDTHVFSTPGEHHWIYEYEYHTELPRFLPDYREPYSLSKHRAHLEPEQMRDIAFKPFDPGPRLNHEKSGVRQEAVTHLGLVRSPGADSLLVSFLARADAGAETYCTLWALGEVGGPLAEEALLSRAEDHDLEVRLEALAALGHMSSHRALPLVVRGLTQTAGEWSPMLTGMGGEIQRLSFEQLVSLGDPACEAPLQLLAREHSGRAAWRDCAYSSGRDRAASRAERDLGRNPGALALLILAALNQGGTLPDLVDALVRSGGWTESGLSTLRGELERLAHEEGARDPLLRKLAADEVARMDYHIAWAAKHPRRL